jgi:hypothetical protein
MITRRATVVTPRTLTARIAKLEAARPSDEVSQALARELMELLRRRKRAGLMRPLVAQMWQSTERLASGDDH